MEKIVDVAIVICLIWVSSYLIGRLLVLICNLELNFGKGTYILFVCAMGWIVELAVFQLLCIPMVIYDMAFSLLANVSSIVIGILSLLSLVICRKRLFVFEGGKSEEAAKGDRGYRIVAIVLIVLQCILCFLFEQIAEDGIFDYSLAAHTLNTDRMFRTYAYTVYECSLSYYADRFINSWYMYKTFLSKITKVHPTIIGRTLLPSILVAISYACYYLTGRYVLKSEEKTNVFIICLSALNIFGRMKMSPMQALLTATDNGKSIFVNILLPLILLIILYWNAHKESLKPCIYLFLLNICAVAMSTTALVYGALVTIVLALVISIRQKKVSIAISTIICIIPNGVFLLVYIVEKGWGLWR